MLFKNVLGQNTGKKYLKKKFLTFCMFFKIKGSILRFFFTFFYCFSSNVIK